jgi:endo-1,4-beta-xylanase
VARLCRRLGQAGLVQQAFAHARRANPSAALLLNDFVTSEKYARLIRGCLDAGVSIDVIGIQSHMHRRYWGARKAWDVCERFAEFKKPLHFTELTILSGEPKTDDDWHRQRTDWHTTADGEKRQARNVEDLYRVLFSHPAVEAITWWDFSDLGSWQGAPAGLVRKDMTPKPAYEALMKLIKGQWWTGELKLTTDAAGKVRFRGFLGAYKLTAAKASCGFRLDEAGKAELTVRAK